MPELEVESDHRIVGLEVRLLAQRQGQSPLPHTSQGDRIQIPAQDRDVQSHVRLGPGRRRSRQRIPADDAAGPGVRRQVDLHELKVLGRIQSHRKQLDPLPGPAGFGEYLEIGVLDDQVLRRVRESVEQNHGIVGLQMFEKRFPAPASGLHLVQTNRRLRQPHDPGISGIEPLEVVEELDGDSAIEGQPSDLLEFPSPVVDGDAVRRPGDHSMDQRADIGQTELFGRGIGHGRPGQIPAGGPGAPGYLVPEGVVQHRSDE